MQKGVEFKQPQPLPEQFGYDPNANDPASQAAASKNEPTTANSNPQGQQ